MFTKGPFRSDIDTLGELAEFCYNASSDLLSSLPNTRASQQKIADALEVALDRTEFSLSMSFLTEEVSINDTSLIEGWCSSPRQLAWLMVHEEMSHYFIRYAMRRWNPRVFIVHHVPKAAGTSVNEFLHNQQYFVWFPQNEFEVMVELHGLLGFAAQVVKFQYCCGQDRIYVGGHFNFPDTISALGLFGDCHGVTLCRQPLDILCSAARYIWTQVETTGSVTAAQYGLSGLDPEVLVLLHKNIQTSPIGVVREIFMAILDSPQFRREYEDTLVKYYYNHAILSPEDLFQYLVDCGSILPCLNVQKDAAATLAALGVSGELPCSNVSTFSTADFLRAMGGVDNFTQLAKPRMVESLRIYETLMKVRARHD